MNFFCFIFGGAGPSLRLRPKCSGYYRLRNTGEICETGWTYYPHSQTQSQSHPARIYLRSYTHTHLQLPTHTPPHSYTIDLSHYLYQKYDFSTLSLDGKLVCLFQSQSKRIFTDILAKFASGNAQIILHGLEQKTVQESRFVH